MTQENLTSPASPTVSEGTSCLPDAETQAPGLASLERPMAPRVKIRNDGRSCQMYYDSEPSLEAALGTKEEPLTRLILNQLVNILSPDPDRPVDEDVLNAALAAVHGLKPADELEAMLAVQMFAAHHLAMQSAKRAMNVSQDERGTDMYLKHTEKLMRVYAAQMEALQRYRGKGQQRMTVEHVHIHSGAQAVVGQVGAK